MILRFQAVSSSGFGALFPAMTLVFALFFCGAAGAQEGSSGGSPPGGSSSGGAQTEKPLTRLGPDEAVDLAIKNNLTLASSAIDLDTKKRASDLVWNLFLPSFDARGTLAVDNVKAADTPLSPYPSSQWHVQGALSSQLNISFALFAGIKSIREGYQEGLVTYEKAKIQTERDVRKAYYQILLMQERLNLTYENYNAADKRVTQAEANYRAGLAPELTWLQAQVSRENIKPTINELENGLSMLMAQFAMTLGLPYDTVFELTPASDGIMFIPLETADLISKASSGKPDIQELRQTLVVVTSQRRAQAMQLYTPYISLGWNMSPSFLRNPWKDEWGNKDNWNTKGTSAGAFSITLGWSLMDLFPFSQTSQKLKDTDNSIRKLNIGLAQMIRGTELEVYNTVLSLEKTRSSVTAQQGTIDLAERSYRLTEQAYNAGLSELLEVQNAELQLQSARIQMLQYNFDYLGGLIDLEYSIGVPFGTLSRSK
jgi:outer membrane protein TolC